MQCVPPKTCALDKAGGRPWANCKGRVLQKRPSSNWQAELLKRFKPGALRLSPLFAQTFLLVSFVLLVVAVKECPLRITFASEDMRGNTVQEPAVMANHHDAAGELQ